MIEAMILPEKMSEYGYQEKAERHKRHHGKVRNGACKHNSAIFKKIYKTPYNDF